MSYRIVAPDIRRPELSVFELAGDEYEQAGHGTGDEVLRVTAPFSVEVNPVAGPDPR